MTSSEPPAPIWSSYTHKQRIIFLFVLFLVSTSNYLDRYLISVVLEPIKQEFQVSDTMLGLLTGFSFSLCYAILGLPVARWADRGNRVTIITIALSIWSVMTMFCGLAQSFLQLALARVGVGVGEAGAIPPAQSLIADYFPPERRASAIAIFTSAGTVGYLLGFGAGGYIAATFGWRSAFLIAGVPGLLLAMLTLYALPEPRTRFAAADRAAMSERVAKTFAVLRKKRSFLYALGAFIFYNFFAYGVLIFIPSFLVRVLEAPLGKASVTYGGVTAVATVIGTLGGGWLADRLARRDIRWLAWLPAVTCFLALPFFMAAFASNNLTTFVSLIFVAMTLVISGLSPGYTGVHSLCGGNRRATAIAIVLFCSTLFGGGFGPLATGIASDAFTNVYGAQGLRFALILNTSVLALSGLMYFLFGKALPVDQEKESIAR